MLRPFWCDDSTTTLRTLDDWLATHGDLSLSPDPPMEGRCFKNRARLRKPDQLLLQVCQTTVLRIAATMPSYRGCYGSSSGGSPFLLNSCPSWPDREDKIPSVPISWGAGSRMRSHTLRRSASSGRTRRLTEPSSR